MKKIVLIMLAALSVMMLSSCIIVAEEEHRYDITCCNDTYVTITDWCVKKNDHITYANSDHNCEIPGGYEDTIEDLSKGDYQIFFTFQTRARLHEDDYEYTGSFYLKDDVKFSVATRTIYSRSAAPSSTDADSVPVLVFSDGRVVKLQPCNE